MPYLLLSVPPYNPHGQFEMSHLYRLEDAGIKVVKSLVENFTQLQSAAGITLSEENKLNWRGEKRSVINCVEIVIGQWSVKKGCYPPTWSSLFEVLSQMNLEEISQQIEDFLTGE